MMELSIPDVPVSLNVWSRMHWRKRRQLQKTWDWWISVALQTCGPIPYELPLSRAQIRIHYLFRQARRRDKDNYVPKMVLDALRHNGVIEDDSTEHLDLDWTLAVNRFGQRTVIELCDLPEMAND